MLRTRSVKGGNDRFGRDRSEMHAAKIEVLDFLRMIERPLRRHHARIMTGVRRSSRVAPIEGRGEIGIIDKPRVPSLTEALIFSVPSGHWHPDFELDVGVWRGLY